MLQPLIYDSEDAPSLLGLGQLNQKATKSISSSKPSESSSSTQASSCMSGMLSGTPFICELSEKENT